MFSLIWKFKKPLFLFSFCFFLTLLKYCQIILEEDYLARSEDIKKYHPLILKDLEIIEDNILFDLSKTKKNADAYISKYIPWGSAHSEELSSFTKLLSDYPNWKENPESFKKVLEHSEIHSIDTLWVDRLSDFDHWNIFNNPILTSDLKNVSKISGFSRVGLNGSLSLPNYLEYKTWGTLRSIQLLSKGQTEIALDSLRHMAFLSFSSGTTIGNLTALSILKMERVFTNLLEINGRKLPDENTLFAYKRVTMAWNTVFEYSSFHGLPDNFSRYLMPKFGVCNAFWNDPIGFAGTERLLESGISFGRSFDEELNQWRLFRKKGFKMCGMSSFKPFLTKPKKENGLLFFVNLPLVKDVVAYYFLSISYPNWLSLYDE